MTTPTDSPKATCTFVPADVWSLREDWPEQDAVDFLETNRKYIVEAMCRAGWAAIEQLLEEEE